MKWQPAFVCGRCGSSAVYFIGDAQALVRCSACGLADVAPDPLRGLVEDAPEPAARPALD